MAKAATKTTRGTARKQASMTQPVPRADPTLASAPKRRIKVPTYTSFKLQKKVTRTMPQTVPSAWSLLRGTFGLLKQNWKLFGGIALVYAALNLALVSGFSAINLDHARQSFSDAVSGQINQLATGLSLFVYLLGNSVVTSSPTASVYQIVLGIIVSLAVIWALREAYVGNRPRVRDAYYKSMHPLVPFVLVLFVIGLEIIPLAAAGFVYTLIINNGIAATAIEQVMWLSLFFLFAIATMYMLCSTLFALYIVSLPDMTPLAAMRSARQLVLHRRWTVLRKLLFLPFSLIVLTGIIVTPLIMFLTPIAPWVFFGLSMLVLPIVHGYLYSLYRSLL